MTLAGAYAAANQHKIGVVGGFCRFYLSPQRSLLRRIWK
jgi:hypothetical protein